jgi:hypothetical protein
MATLESNTKRGIRTYAELKDFYGQLDKQKEEKDKVDSINKYYKKDFSNIKDAMKFHNKEYYSQKNREINDSLARIKKSGISDEDYNNVLRGFGRKPIPLNSQKKENASPNVKKNNRSMKNKKVIQENLFGFGTSQAEALERYRQGEIQRSQNRLHRRKVPRYKVEEYKKNAIERERRCGDRIYIDRQNKKYIYRDDNCEVSCGKLKRIFNHSILVGDKDLTRTAGEIIQLRCN